MGLRIYMTTFALSRFSFDTIFKTPHPFPHPPQNLQNYILQESINLAVMFNFWATVLCCLAAEDACFRMRITLRVVLIRSLAFQYCVSECSQNGSGVRPYLWVQEKFVYFRQSIQIAGLCPVELLGQVCNDSAFNVLKNLCDIYIVNSRNGRAS